MRELSTPYSRRTPLEGTHDFVWCFFWRGFHKQMNVIGLDSQVENRPSLFTCYLLTDFTKASGNVANQYFLAALCYPYQMIVHLIHCMIGASDFTSFHAGTLKYINRMCKENVRFHPGAKALGFPAPKSYKILLFVNCSPIDRLRQSRRLLRQSPRFPLTRYDRGTEH